MFYFNPTRLHFGASDPSDFYSFADLRNMTRNRFNERERAVIVETVLVKILNSRITLEGDYVYD